MATDTDTALRELLLDEGFPGFDLPLSERVPPVYWEQLQLPQLTDPHSAYFGVFHPFRDVPLGTRFCSLMPSKGPAPVLPVAATLERVSLRRGHSGTEVPCGYSAICAVRFEGPMPGILYTLPPFDMRGSRPFGLLRLLTEGLADAIRARCTGDAGRCPEK